jgi:hypothetical protein
MTVAQAINRIVLLAEPPNESRYRQYLERLREHELQRLLNTMEEEQDKPANRGGWIRAGRHF